MTSDHCNWGEGSAVAEKPKPPDVWYSSESFSMSEKTRPTPPKINKLAYTAEPVASTTQIVSASVTR